MSVLRVLRSRLLNGVLLGVGLIAWAGPAGAVNFADPFTNSGHITTPLGNGGNVTSFTNTATGTIILNSTTTDPIFVGGNLTNFTNAGTISNNGEGNFGVLWVAGNVTSFDNQSTGVMTSGGAPVVYIDGFVSNFSNEGRLESGGDAPVYLDGSVANFTNSSTGDIHDFGDYHAVFIFGAEGTAAVTQFVNNGTISADGNVAVQIMRGDADTAAGTIFNSGHVSADYSGFDITGDVGDFTNTATGDIHAGKIGVSIDGDLTGSFVNAGTIDGGDRQAAVLIGRTTAAFENSGSIDGSTSGVEFNGDVTSFRNDQSGTIRGEGQFDRHEGILGYGVYLFANHRAFTVTSFYNAGRIEGEAAGVDVDGGAVTSFYNTTTGSITSDTSYGVQLGGPLAPSPILAPSTALISV